MCDSRKDRLEKLLKLYFNDKLNAKYRILKRRSTQDFHPKGMSYEGGGSGGKTNHISNEIENFYVKKDEAGQKVSFLECLIDDIEDALDTLVEEEFKLLKWTYTKNIDLTDEGIARKLSVSYWTVRKRREKLLKDLTGLISVDYYISNAINDLSDYFSNLIQD